MYQIIALVVTVTRLLKVNHQDKLLLIMEMVNTLKTRELEILIQD